MNKQISRRQTIKELSLLFVTFGLGTVGARAQFAVENSKTVQSIIEDLSGKDPDGLSRFWLLSRLITGRNNLELTLAKRIFPYFRAEPWGIEHTIRCFNIAYSRLNSDHPSNSIIEIIDAGDYSDGELWFLSHLLTTWYLGIYYHERLTERVLYEDALMWDVISDIVPVPGYSQGDFGYWINPPHYHEDKHK